MRGPFGERLARIRQNTEPRVFLLEALAVC